MTARRAVVLLAVGSTLVRFVLATRVQSASIMPDEAVFALAGRSFWHTGHFLLLDARASFYGLYAPVAGLPLAIWGPSTGLTVLKFLQALLVSSTAVLAYEWARQLTGPWWSFGAATATAALPFLGYSGLMMTESLYLPVVTLALFTTAMSLRSPTRLNQSFAVVALLVAALVRVQGLVLVPTFVLAVLLAAWFARDKAMIRRFLPSFAVLALVAVVLALMYLLGVFAHPLGAYTPVAQSHYHLGSVTIWVIRHAGDAFLVVIGIPLIATLLMGVQAARGVERDAGFAATLAVVLSYTCLLIVQVGIFASEFVGQLAERYLVSFAPAVFVVFMVWLGRGMPRPQPVTYVVAVAVALPALFLPLQVLVTQFATIDAFMITPFLRLRESSSYLTLEIVWSASVVILVVLMLVLPRRAAPALAAGVVCALAVSSGFAANDLENWTRAERTFLFGSSDLRWIDRSTTQNVLYLYGGDPYWNRVWQLAFWNERVVTVAALPTQIRLGRDLVSGSLPGKTAVVLDPDGHVRRRDGGALQERLVAASDDVALIGERVKTRHGPRGFSLWRIDGPPVIAMWTQGLTLSGEIRDLVTVTVPNCRTGALDVGLTGLTGTSVVRFFVDGSPLGTATVRPGGQWHGSIPSPLNPTVRTSCIFGVRSPGGVRLTRVEYKPRSPRPSSDGANAALLGRSVAYCVKGSFTMLLYRQPETDRAYRGATAANFVKGKGLTCDLPPTGYRRKGLADQAMHVPADFYPYYAP